MKISQFYRKAKDSYIEFHAQAGFKFRFVALIGTICFPLYYFIWTYLFPQPYENLTLRTIGSVLCFILSFSKYWPKKIRKYDILFTYFCLAYALPFFFTYMLLMNEGNMVWQLSMMTALLFTILLYDTINMILVTISGVILGIFYFFLHTGSLHISPQVLIATPIFGFALLGLFFFSYNDGVIVREKLKTASLLAGQIAHEMRTPLLGIQLEADKTSRFMPVFLEVYEWAKSEGWSGPKISTSQLTGLSGSMKRIKDHSSSANLMIDTLLMNVRHQDFSAENYEICSVKDTILTTLERYHFKGNDRSLISYDEKDDFVFWGSQLLLTHVLFNLLRNALRAIQAKSDGSITIKIQSTDDSNQIIFSDTGLGMDEDFIRYIFIPFFSGVRPGTGAGVGLSFARSVIESFGGSIECYSELGIGTTFIISLPKITS